MDKKEETSTCQERHFVLEEVNSDGYDIESTKFFQEAADLLTCFYMAIDAANSDSDTDHPRSEDKSGQTMSIPKTDRALNSSKRMDLQTNESMDLSFYTQKEEQSNYGQTSVIRIQNKIPDIGFTSEELCCIKAQEKVQKLNLFYSILYFTNTFNNMF